MFVKYSFLWFFLCFSQLSYGSESGQRPAKQVSTSNVSNGKRRVTFRLYPVVVPPYSQYQPPNLLYPGYPYGNTYPVQGNIFADYPYYGNMYQGNINPYQQGYNFADIPTRIIDVDNRGNMKISNNNPVFSLQQQNTKSSENKRYPLKFVKTSFATTKPITITINRSAGQDSVMNYNFQNGELLKPRKNESDSASEKSILLKSIEKNSTPVIRVK